MKPSRRTTVAVGCLVAGLLATSLWNRAGARTAEVAQADLHREVYAGAVLEPRDGTAEVRPRIAGTIVEVRVREGDRVQTGQALAVIEAAGRQAELRRRLAERNELAEVVRALSSGADLEERKSRQAEVAAAHVHYRAADVAAKHQQRLAHSGSGSAAAAEQAQLDAEAARAGYDSAVASSRLAILFKLPSELRAARERLAAAEAQVEIAEREAASGQVVSSIDGIVLGRHCNVGDVVAAAASNSPPIFEIGDLRRLSLRAELDELDLERVAVGLPVRVHSIASNAKVADGTVARMGARVQRRTIGWADPREPLVRTLWIDVNWNRSTPPPVGERFEVRIQLPARKVAAALPRAALTIRDGIASIQVPWGPFWRTLPVKLGLVDRERVEVPGLAPGTRARIVD